MLPPTEQSAPLFRHPVACQELSEQAEAALLCLRTARQAEREMRNTAWRCLGHDDRQRGVLVLADLAAPGAIGPVSLGIEPGSVLAPGVAKLSWRARSRSGHLDVVVSATQPAWARPGAVSLGAERAWVELRKPAELASTLGELARLGAPAAGVLEDISGVLASSYYPSIGDEAAAAAGRRAARRLVTAYAGPHRPSLSWQTALLAEVSLSIGIHTDGIGPGAGPLPWHRLLRPLASRRSWPELPDAKVLCSLVSASDDCAMLCRTLQRYDASKRLWWRPPKDLGQVSAWLDAERARSGGVVGWPDVGALAEAWCARSAKAPAKLNAPDALALLVSANTGDFANMLCNLAGV